MDAGTPLPGPLRLSPTFAFAGRTQELATLRALLPRSAGEGRRAALVAGDPGSGKSRLVRELARELAEEGTTVLYGDCDAVVVSPVRPVRGRPRASRTAHRARGAAGAPRCGRRRADAAHAGARGARRRPARARGDRLRCGAPPPPHRRDRAARRHQLGSTVAPRARGRALGGRVHAAADAAPRALRRGGSDAPRGHLPRRGRGRARRARGGARRRVPHRGSRAHPARRVVGGRDRRVRPADDRRRAHRRADVGRGRPHRRQRVPGHRALAGADRLRRRRGRRVRRASLPAGGRARGPDDGAGRRQPEALAARTPRRGTSSSWRP